MTVRRDKVHDNLGMILDSSSPGKFIIDMENYINKVMKDLPDEFNGTATIPAETLNNSIKLDGKEVKLFHHITAQLLFLCKRGCPGILTAVSFLYS